MKIELDTISEATLTSPLPESWKRPVVEFSHAPTDRPSIGPLNIEIGEPSINLSSPNASIGEPAPLVSERTGTELLKSICRPRLIAMASIGDAIRSLIDQEKSALSTADEMPDRYWRSIFLKKADDIKAAKEFLMQEVQRMESESYT